MATKEQIFKALAPFQDKGPDRKILGKGIGEDYRHFQSQLDRWVKQELLKESQHRYLLTENGRKELAEMLHPGLDEAVGTPGVGIEKKSAYFQLSITQDDLNRLSAWEFKTVWADLGKIIRSRGQALEEKKTV